VGGRALRLNMADERPRERTGGPPRDRPGGPPRGDRPGPPRSFGPPSFEPEPSFFPVEGRLSRPKGSRRGARGRKRSL